MLLPFIIQLIVILLNNLSYSHGHKFNEGDKYVVQIVCDPAIYRDAKFVCEGVLISRHTVLTTSVCAKKSAKGYIEYKYKENKLEIIGIKDIFINEETNFFQSMTNKILGRSVDNDLALIYLIRPAPEIIESVTLSTDTSYLGGKHGISPAFRCEHEFSKSFRPKYEFCYKENCQNPGHPFVRHGVVLGISKDYSCRNTTESKHLNEREVLYARVSVSRKWINKYMID